MKIVVSRWLVETTKKLGYVIFWQKTVQPIKIPKDNELEFSP